MSKIALIGLALSLVVVAETAYAEGACPAGEIDIDSKCGGGYCTPVCAPIQNYGGGSGRAPQPQGEISTLGLQTIAGMNERRLALQALRSLGPGHWNFGKGKPGNCYAAGFVSSKGGITVPSDGGLLLVGPEIPVEFSAKPKHVHVVVVTTGGTPIQATARQAHYVPMMGSLQFMPPFDPEQVFTADRLNIRVQSNGKTIFSLDVPDGLKVREKIRQCKQLSGIK